MRHRAPGRGSGAGTARAARRRVAAWLARLRATPLHPQWLLGASQRALESRLRAIDGGATVLDIGCADQWPRAVLPADCAYLGLDLPDTAVDWYGTRPQVYATADLLPLRDASADVVLLLDVLEHLAHEARAMAEIARVLRPGGIAILRVPFLYPVHDAPRDFRRLTRFGLAQLAARHGLDTLSRQGFGAGLEAAALLANLGIARICLNAWRHRPALLVAALPLLALVPAINLLGRVSALAERDAEYAPYSETVVLRRPAGPSP